jgi:hypothetical protein
MALALDEARLRADDLAKSLDSDYQNFKKVIEASQKGVFTQLFNKGVDPQLGNDLNNQLANIRTLARQQKDALAKGNQESADDLGNKLRTAQEKALSFADSETAKRSGMVEVGTARQSTYAGTYGNQDLNFDTINAFKDLVGSQIDTADQQKRNTADQARAKALEQSNQAQKQLLSQMEETLAKQRAQYGVSVAAELAYWSARIGAFSKGSEQYRTVQMDQYRLQAELYQQLNEGKKKFLADAKSDVEGNDLLGAGAQAFAKLAEEQAARSTAATKQYNDELARGAEIGDKQRTAFEESALQMAVMQGSISHLGAAQALAAIHAHDHAKEIQRVNEALARQLDLINSDTKLTDEDKAGLTRNAKQAAANQTSSIDGAYATQNQSDQQKIRDQQLGPATRDALARMIQDWTNMSSQIVQVMTKAADSFNDDIVKAVTGKGGKADFGKTLLDAGQGLLKTSLQSAEGNILKSLGLGGPKKKPTGAAGDPIHTVNDGQGAGIGANLPAFIRPFIGGNPQSDEGGSKTPGGFLGGLAQGLLGGIGEPDSGPSADGAPAPKGGIGGFFGNLLGIALHSFQGGFAGGGDFLANHPMLVGERGPELMTPGFSGHVTPNNQLGGGGGGDTHIHVDARGSNDPAAIHAAIMRAAPHIVAASVQANHQAAKRRSPGGR